MVKDPAGQEQNFADWLGVRETVVKGMCSLESVWLITWQAKKRR